MRISSILQIAGLAGAAAVLVGCGATPSVPTITTKPAAISGKVFGGQQPITGATIQLYTVGTSGDGAGSSPLLTQTVTTDSNGSFNITGLYSCASATQVYLTSTGGYVSGVQNANATLMAALGACTSLSAATYITMNELTTVAAVNALYPYMSVTAGAAPVVGSGTSDVAALDAAFTLAGQFVNTTNGSAPGNVPTGYVAPTTEINTLGDAMANCVNSGGGVANDGTGCGNFFGMTTPTSGTAPVDTVAALLNLAKNPVLNTGGLYASTSPTSPFQPQLPAQPTDFSVALTPVGSLQISPSSIGFGSVTEGTNPAAVPVTISNSSATAVTIGSIGITGTGAGSFSDTTTCGTTLAAGASCTVQVSAYLTTTGLQSASLVVTSSGTGSPQSVGLSATGVAPPTGGTLTSSATKLGWSFSQMYQDVTLTNGGSTSLVFVASAGTTAFSVGGVGVNGFSVGSGGSCNGLIPAGGSCTVTVLATGASASDTLTIASNASNGTITIPMYASILGYPYSGSWPSSVTLGTSASTTFGINVQYGTSVNSTLTIGGANPGDFSAPNCNPADGQFGSCYGCRIQPTHTTCSGPLVFTPMAVGNRSAKLYFSGSVYAGGQYISSNQYVPVGGTGAAVPLLTLSPSSLTFASTPTGGTTALQVAVLTASSSAAAAINSISITGTNASDFAETTICPATLYPGNYCTIEVTFSPTAPGTRTASLQVNGGALSASLSGVGVISSTAPPGLSSSSLYYGGIGQQQLVTLANFDSIPLGIKSIKFGTSNYTEVDNCNGSLGGQSFCNIYITALYAGTNDTMTITDSAGTQTVTLIAPGYGVIVNWGAELIGNSIGSGPQSIKLDYDLHSKNYMGYEYYGGNLTFTNPNAKISGQYGCSSTSVSGCTLSIYFTTSTLGWQYDYGTDNGGNGYTLEAFGTSTGSAIVTSSLALNYGGTIVGQKSQLTLTVTNAGGSNGSSVPFTYSGASFSGGNTADFSLVSTTCSTLSSPLSSCTITIKFTPQATGVRSSTLTIANPSGTAASVAVTGVGYTVLPVTTYAAPVASPTSLAFPSTAVGSSATPLATNVTMPNLDPASATITGSGFSFFSGTSCAQGASTCQFAVSFTPAGSGAATGTLTVTDTITNMTTTVALSGTGTTPPPPPPVVSLSPTSLTFIPRSVGQQSLPQTITLTNTGGSSLTISSVTLGGTNPGDYAMTNGCSGSIAVNGTCTISVSNDPTFVGASSATITIVTNAASSPNVVNLSGTGQ